MAHAGGRPPERCNRYGGDDYVEQRERHFMKPHEAVERAYSLRNYLLQKGWQSLVISRNGLDNPFRTPDALMCIINQIQREGV